MAADDRAAGSAGAAHNAGIRILEPKITRWYCPSCHREDRTKIAAPHSHYHQCSKLRGAWVPFVEEGIKAGIKVNRRGDYVGTDLVTTDGEGNPVMSVTTERNDGEDCAIFAPCATAKVSQDDHAQDALERAAGVLGIEVGTLLERVFAAT